MRFVLGTNTYGAGGDLLCWIPVALEKRSEQKFYVNFGIGVQQNPNCSFQDVRMDNLCMGV